MIRLEGRFGVDVDKVQPLIHHTSNRSADSIDIAWIFPIKSALNLDSALYPDYISLND